jgi:hypothetical protein
MDNIDLLAERYKLNRLADPRAKLLRSTVVLSLSEKYEEGWVNHPVTTKAG